MRFDLHEEENILKIIDFINQHRRGIAEVNNVFSCKRCNKNFPDGEFYYDEGGYSPGPEVIDLGIKRINFPLHKLHTFLTNGGSDRSYEQYVIMQLFDLSREWNYFDVPKQCFNEYEKVMNTSSLLEIASLEFEHWCNLVRTTPDYTEEEMSQDPNKRWIMETEKAINNKPNELKNVVKSEIDYVFQEIIGNKQVPRIYLVPKEMQSDIGDKYFKLSFIENTYNTLKAKNIFFPDQKRTSLIEKINSYSHNVEVEHKKNPPF